MIEVGIEKIGFYTPEQYVSMEDLADARGIDPNKFLIGIGQAEMAVPTIDMDIVAMAANACEQIIDEADKQLIDQVIFATESSFDYSKAGATYLHGMLGIQPFAKVFEIKQACYGGTAGIQMACDYVRLRPNRKVLVVMSDISKYGLNTGGEPTQGAGAVAVLVSAEPKVLAIDLESTSLSFQSFDFWRPQYSKVALVEGHYSTELYLDLFEHVVQEVQAQRPNIWEQIDALYFHLPFTKMGKKALDRLLAKGLLDEERYASLLAHYESSAKLGRRVGNIYTGSLYLSFLSGLVYDQKLQAGDHVGLFSYGSGAVGEFLTGTLHEGAFTQAIRDKTLQQFEQRQAISVATYEEIYQDTLPETGVWQNESSSQQPKGYYLAEIDKHRRRYGYN